MATATELAINTAATAEQMFETIFGEGVQLVSGTATFSGATVSSGIYTGATTSIPGISPTDSGVILSTGNVADFTNNSGTTDTNVSPQTGTNTTGGIDGDPQLNAVSGQATFDGAILTADFIPDGDILTMQFVFSSEEYPEYVNGNVNDSFGVWINGQFVPVSISVAGNVAIDSVNAGLNENLYIDNTADQLNSEMDGLTYVLSIKAPVNAGQVNSIKIGIADGGDSIYDSNLLIMADSAQTIVLAMDDEVNVVANGSRTFDILANDAVRDGGLTITQINGQNVTAGQTVSLTSGQQVQLNADGTITVFATGVLGEENFTYTVSDGTTTDIGYVTINTLTAPARDGIVSGTSGNDVIGAGYLGDPDGDLIDSNDGLGVQGTTGNADLIYAGAGNDSVLAGAGNDIVHAGDGKDTIDGGDGDDSIDLGAADGDQDTLVLSNGFGADAVQGFEGPIDNGDGTFTGRDLLDSTGLTASGRPVNAGDVAVTDDGFGNALLTFPGGESLTLVGIPPAAVTSIQALHAMGLPLSDGTVQGTAGDNLIDLSYLGDPDGDRVDSGDAHLPGAGPEDDLIVAGAGNDTAFGGTGNDEIFGGTGNDSLIGEDGDDTLRGEEGSDFLNGVTGNDVLYGGAGADFIEAGIGNDQVHGDDGDDSLNGDQGNDTVYGGAGNDYVRGSFGNDTVGGGEGDDYVWGGYGDDVHVVEDNFGNDTYYGDSEQEIFGDRLDLSAITTGVTLDLTNAIPERGSFTDGISTATFDEMEHIVLSSGADTVVLADFGGQDRVTGFAAPIDNGDGTYSGIDLLDVTGLTSDFGTTPVRVKDVTVTTDLDGNAVLTFPGGESLTLVGVPASAVSSPAQLAAMGIPLTDYTIEGTAGADIIDAGYLGDPDGDRVDANDAADGSQDDIILAGAGEDQVDAGQGNDLIYGGIGGDSINAGDGNDHIEADEGDDSLFGDAGDDTLLGGDGADVLDGGLGADSLDGGAGSDTLIVAEGDTATGGTGDDLFDLVDLGESTTGTLFVDGGSGDETGGDTLRLGTLADLSTLVAVDDGTGSFSGTVTLDDGTVLTFTEIENIICFTPGTRIATARGARPVESLAIGDQVVTRDHGLQRIRWIGRRTVPAQGKLAPIRIRPGVVTGLERDLMISPQHRMLFQGYRAELLFGESEVLVSAAHLVDGLDVTRETGGEVTYIHILFDDHEIIYAEGAATESFHPGEIGLDAIAPAAREELFAIFPELRTLPSSYGRTARRCLRRHEAQLIRI